jgi:hypothetical protein
VNRLGLDELQFLRTRCDVQHQLTRLLIANLRVRSSVSSLLYRCRPFHISDLIAERVVDSFETHTGVWLWPNVVDELLERFKPEDDSPCAVITKTASVGVGASLLCVIVRLIFGRVSQSMLLSDENLKGALRMF